MHPSTAQLLDGPRYRQYAWGDMLSWDGTRAFGREPRAGASFSHPDSKLNLGFRLEVQGCATNAVCLSPTQEPPPPSLRIHLTPRRGGFPRATRDTTWPRPQARGGQWEYDLKPLRLRSAPLSRQAGLDNTEDGIRSGNRCWCPWLSRGEGAPLPSPYVWKVERLYPRVFL